MSVSVGVQPPLPRERQRGDPPEHQRRPEDEETGAAVGRGGGGGAGDDPAVLAVGPARRPLQYSREQLLAVRGCPLARQPPDIRSDAFNTIRKRTESPNEEDRGARGDAPGDNHKGVYPRGERRAADPRERVRKESEPSGGGIVLSPQRRSFTSGCGAPGAPVPAPPPNLARTRPESPLSATAPNKQEPVRRIGSGRIIARDVTQAPWERGSSTEGRSEGGRTEAREEVEPERVERTYSSQPYRPPPAVARDRGDDRFERRSFGRDSFGTDMKRERDRDDRFTDKRDRDDNRRMNNNRYGGQRRYEKEIAEPEWYSGGPTSQLETIELRGFDEPVREKKTNGSAKDSDKWSSGGRSPVSGGGSERWRSGATSPPPARSTPTPHADNVPTHEKESGTQQPPEAAEDERGGSGGGRHFEEPPLPPPDDDFNFDDFLKFDSIPDMLTNGTSESEGRGSRFSRWFQHSAESPTHHHEQLLNNMMDDLESNSVEPPNMFAPISPAGNLPHAARPPSLLELLQRANAASGTPHPQPHEMNSGPGKIQSLEELEARLRGARPPPPHHHRPPPPQHRVSQQDSDLAVFKKLLAQASGGHAVPANSEPPPQQPLSIMQMLNKSMEQQHKQQQQQQQHQQQHHQQQHQQHHQQQQPHIPKDVLYKLLQVQQQQQQEMASASASHGEARELLQRPEAIAIISGMKQGEISIQNIMQQLNNPGLQSRHRDMLLSIMRVHNNNVHHQMGGSPLPGPGAPHLLVPPHQQPLRLSPLPHTGMPSRIPSPRELAAHTQSIMQSALIKKKLEEQRENYRRRQEQPKQSTPIAFTPTSVLRKMTAEKELESPNGGKPQQWGQMPQKMPQGRPIVKGNHGGGGAGGLPHMNNMFPQQQDFPSQPHYLNHPQMSSGMRQYPHQQQRQTPSQLDSLYMNSRGGAGGGNTLQQLFQSQHRGMNDLAGSVGMGGMGGDATSNQLARWFSPELLAQASAGKLPSVHVPNALSLEDLERNHHSTTVRN